MGMGDNTTTVQNHRMPLAELVFASVSPDFATEIFRSSGPSGAKSVTAKTFSPNLSLS